MNRRQMIIGGIMIAVLLVVGLVVLVRRLGEQVNQQADAGQSLHVLNLTYCNENQVKPCVVSFSLDADDNMLINILLPDLLFPDFYLNITRGEDNVSYECQRTVAAPNSAYCIGGNLPPGELLHVMLFLTKNDALLAEGDLSIIGLAFPTVGVALPTKTATPTKPAPTATESVSTAAATHPSTQPSYP